MTRERDAERRAEDSGRSEQPPSPSPSLDASNAAPGEGTPCAPFPIVAVGGSAGSLAAFQELLRQLPVGLPMTLVIVSHQNPYRSSLLAEILAKSTVLPVVQLRSRYFWRESTAEGCCTA